LGNLDARRDWGYAPEYTDAMWRMLQADVPDDYVIATGTSFSVRDFIELAFDSAGLDWTRYVRFDSRYLRPAEVDSLIGDASKARENLGWTPKVQVPELARLMVEADIEAFGVSGESQSVVTRGSVSMKSVRVTAT
jgi:GDPmannose 4,6-dehydratase